MREVAAEKSGGDGRSREREDGPHAHPSIVWWPSGPFHSPNLLRIDVSRSFAEMRCFSISHASLPTFGWLTVCFGGVLSRSASCCTWAFIKVSAPYADAPANFVGLFDEIACCAFFAWAIAMLSVPTFGS